MGYYDDRKLHSVSTGDLNQRETADGPLVVMSVYISVTGADGRTVGPGVAAQVAIPATEDASLREIKDQGLQLAHDLVKRLSHLTIDELREALAKPPEFDVTVR